MEEQKPGIILEGFYVDIEKKAIINKKTGKGIESGQDKFDFLKELSTAIYDFIFPKEVFEVSEYAKDIKTDMGAFMLDNLLKTLVLKPGVITSMMEDMRRHMENNRVQDAENESNVIKFPLAVPSSPDDSA